MHRRFALPTAAVVAALSATLIAPTSADAARCVSGAEVRKQVSTFVHSLRDDVKSADVRKEVRAALKEVARTAQGEEADTPKERRGLGKEISALARQKKDAENRLERAALNAQIHALQEQKRADHTAAQELKKLSKDVERVGKQAAKASDTRGEGRQIAAFAHDFMDQFNC
jgi:hypothetical protein